MYYYFYAKVKYIDHIISYIMYIMDPKFETGTRNYTIHILQNCIYLKVSTNQFP